MPEAQPGLLPVGDYVERILATISPLPAFPQPLMEALGLALAEDVVAPISLPSFDNSAMDGYAVVFRDVAEAVLAPRLSDKELSNLERSRPGGMQIDPARYGLLAGLSVDLYFGSGGFLSPRAMMALPLLSGATGTGLGLWWELSLGLGWTL